MTRRPTTSMTATKAATLASVIASGSASVDQSNAAGRAAFEDAAPAPAADQRQHHGEVLDDQPADRDAAALGLEQAALLQARSSTTVLATDSARPKTRPAPIDQPSHHARPMPSSVATAICTIAPGMAMARTDSRSLSEKCRPTPNISRMTPISASSLAMPWSATKPGVNGPTSDAREQIADQRRDPQPLRHRAEDEGEHEAGDDRGDERRVMRHRLVPAILSVLSSEYFRQNISNICRRKATMPLATRPLRCGLRPQSAYGNTLTPEFCVTATASSDRSNRPIPKCFIGPATFALTPGS